MWRAHHSEQLQAIFDWISGIARERDVIFVETKSRFDFFAFRFPLRYGDVPRKITGRPEEATFIIREETARQAPPSQEWTRIFSSPEIEVFEKKDRVTDAVPLWRGLTDGEKKSALVLARQTAEAFLSGREFQLAHNVPDESMTRFTMRSDLGVALWVKGRLRGSVVVQGHTLGHGIVHAATSACRDGRFKPLAPEELKDTRMEITVMHPLRVPLSEKEKEADVIYPEKGYLLRLGERQGWFLPEVLNVRKFSNLKDFLGDLAQEKAGLPRHLGRTADVFIFEAEDFIESEDRRGVLSLFGPSVRQDIPRDHEAVAYRLKMAADWLLRVQEPDGNLPPILDPLTGRTAQLDWVRLAFTAWALAEFGTAVNEKKYIQGAAKSFGYLEKYLISSPEFPIPNGELALAYFGRLSLALRASAEAAAARKILERLSLLLFEPITFSQIAAFFGILSKDDQRLRAAFVDTSRVLKENFENNLKGKQLMSLAVWAELANSCADSDKEFSEKVAGWLKGQQLPNGAFPESTASRFAYARGTGKVFEVLARAPQKNKEAIDKALAWLFSLQYDGENTFFVPEEIRARVVGGFRHDYFNHDAWIDAAGHLLLGGARLFGASSLL